MADIKFKEANIGAIKFKDSTALLDDKMKTVGIRTKEELDIYRQDDKNAITYAEEAAGDYVSAVTIAARNAAVGSIRKHRTRSILCSDEQEMHPGSLDDMKHIEPYRSEELWLQDPVSSVERYSEEFGSFPGGSSTDFYGKKYAAKTERNGGNIQPLAHGRNTVMAEERAGIARISHPADISGPRLSHHLTEYADIMPTEAYGTSRFARDRMKELAIKRMHRESGSRAASGAISMPSGRKLGKPGKAKGVDDLLRRLSKGLHANTSSLSIAGVMTVMIIVITIMFTATFSMTGNEDGNDFAYDFYGFAIGDNAIVEVARAQLGNVGGDKFWRWYGFTGHVHWCACFVSWCADQCGYTKAGIIPSYAVCADGASWFKEHHRWASRGYTPKPGDIIFYDWDSDGHMDHTGIVESCDGRTINTIEGNVSNVCRRQAHPVGSGQIAGFGVPVFRPSSGFENACVWAAQIAGDNSFHYVNWRSSDNMTHECPVCHDHPAGNYRGWNCIGFAFACWKHGAGIRCRCSCSVVNDPNWETLLRCSSDTEANKLATRLVGVPCTVIRNGGNAIPVSRLRKGDILAEFNGSTYFHTIFYEGNGKYADCTSGRSDNIRSGNTMSDSTKGKIKVAIRYIG